MKRLTWLALNNVSTATGMTICLVMRTKLSQSVTRRVVSKIDGNQPSLTEKMMIATTPVVVPVIVAMGYSPVWWGIVFVILMETALITPPVGLNLYVVQAVRGGGRFSDLCIGVLPFVAMMIVMISLLIVFPQLALWLPTVLNPKGG